MPQGEINKVDVSCHLCHLDCSYQHVSHLSYEVIVNPQMAFTTTSYTSERGLFTYTITDGYESYNQHIIDAFDKWDKTLSVPNVFIEDGFSEYTIAVSVSFVEFESSNTLGGASLSRYYTMEIPAQYGRSFPAVGEFKLNTLWLDSLASNIKSDGRSELYFVSLHEIGHIVGLFPSGWIGELNNIPETVYLDNTDSSNKKYWTSVKALTEYQNMFPDISYQFEGIPIEDDGGSGTKNYHIEEGSLGTLSSNDRMINNKLHPGLQHALMTGWSDTGNYPLPLTRLSIAFLDDLGFNVSYDEAEQYDPNDPYLSPALTTPTLTTPTLITPTLITPTNDELRVDDISLPLDDTNVHKYTFHVPQDKEISHFYISISGASMINIDTNI